jgi:hypothetical protein
MRAYYNKVQKLEEKFRGFELHQSYRRFNVEEHALVIAPVLALPDFQCLSLYSLMHA